MQEWWWWRLWTQVRAAFSAFYPEVRGWSCKLYFKIQPNVVMHVCFTRTVFPLSKISICLYPPTCLFSCVVCSGVKKKKSSSSRLKHSLTSSEEDDEACLPPKVPPFLFRPSRGYSIRCDFCHQYLSSAASSLLFLSKITCCQSCFREFF